jgi:hypothetical protein
MSAAKFMHIAHLSWHAVLFGLDKGYISWSDVASFAKMKMTESKEAVDSFWPLVDSLSRISKDNIPQLRVNLVQLADLEPQADTAVTTEKWLYVLLAKLRDEPNETGNRFAELERLYAEFDYPSVMVPFVPYMPTLDGYDASKHSYEENMDRLLANWDAYLAFMCTRSNRSNDANT